MGTYFYASVGTKGAERARVVLACLAHYAGELGGGGEGRACAGRLGRSVGFGFEPGDDVGDRQGLVEP
jgi:hypothetical protein